MTKKRKMKVMCVHETKRRGERGRKMAEGYKMLHRRVHREAETKDGGRKRWRRQLGRSGGMEDDRRLKMVAKR